VHFGIRPHGLAAALALLLAWAAPALGSVQSELAFHRGVVAYGENQLDEAQRQFEIVLADDSEDTVSLHYLALIAGKRGDNAAALDLYDRALAIDPEDADIQLDRGIALLDAGRLPEARDAFAKVLELDPNRARAHLFAGIAAYRAGDWEAAKPHLDRAAELDPALRDESRYYAGLSDALLGNVEGAITAFGDAVEQSPLSPLGQSAQNFRENLQTPAQAERRWAASITSGLEYDSNPLILGDLPLTVGEVNPDWRGVVRLNGNYRFVRREDWNLSGGYDGYWSFHSHDNQVNLQTHAPWISGGYNVGRARLGLRYDYSFTFVDTTDPFRHLHRVTPSAAFREGDWGVSYLYYQFHYQDFLRPLLDPATFDRDGYRSLVGLNQFFFLPEPFTYVRLGVVGDFLRTQGTEWSRNGVEALFGAGYDFDYGVSFGWLYRYMYRDYQHATGVPDFEGESRVDHRHVLSLDLAKAITEHWQLSLGGALSWNKSSVAFYDYDRQIGGAYVTYNF
jgi:tetratricopeptide (TPR) repeat protein